MLRSSKRGYSFHGNIVPKKERACPEARMFGMLPASGQYVSPVRGLRLENVIFSAAEGEERPTTIAPR